MSARATAQRLEEYKTFEEWVEGTRPNRRELRRMCKTFGLLGARARGGSVARSFIATGDGGFKPCGRHAAYREVMARAHDALREADSADAMVARRMLDAMEEMFGDEED